MTGLASDHCIGMTQQVQAVLEECWFERYKTLELVQINRSLEQLPVGIIREVCEYQL